MEDDDLNGSLGRVKRLTRQYSTLNRRLREDVERNQKRIQTRKSLNANTFISPNASSNSEEQIQLSPTQQRTVKTSLSNTQQEQQQETQIKEIQITQEHIVLRVEETEPKENQISPSHTNNEIETKKTENDNGFDTHEEHPTFNFSNSTTPVSRTRSRTSLTKSESIESNVSASSIEQVLYSAVQNTIKQVFSEHSASLNDNDGFDFSDQDDEEFAPKEEEKEDLSDFETPKFTKPRSTSIASPQLTSTYEPQLAKRSPLIARKKSDEQSISKSSESALDLSAEDLFNDNNNKKSKKSRKHAKTELPKKLSRAEIKDHQASKSDIKFLTMLTNGTYCVALREWIRQRGSSNPDPSDPNHEPWLMDEATAKKMLLKLDFWIHIESFKNFTPKNHEIIMNEAALLISKYVTRGRNIRESQTLIEDISWDIVLELEQNKEKLNLGSFNRVQHQLFQALVELWPKFKKSSMYKTLKAELRKTSAKKTARKWKDKLSLSKGKSKKAHKMKFNHIATERISYPKNENEALVRIDEFKKHRRIQMKLDRLGLDACPPGLAELSIIHLDLSQNNLTTIPSQVIITNLMYLKEIYLDFNYLTALPSELTFCSFLKVLSVNFNNITTLSDNIGTIETLQYLGVEGNPLTMFPPSLTNLPRLQELRHDNKEYDIPNSILAQKKTKALLFDDLLEYMEFLRRFEVRFNMKSHWVPDKSASSCSECRSDFSKVNRRHHCRFCGQLFCKDCWGFNVFIPYSGREHPVCGACHAALSAANKSSNNNNFRSNSWES